MVEGVVSERESTFFKGTSMPNVDHLVMALKLFIVRSVLLLLLMLCKDLRYLNYPIGAPSPFVSV